MRLDSTEIDFICFLEHFDGFRFTLFCLQHISFLLFSSSFTSPVLCFLAVRDRDGKNSNFVFHGAGKEQ